MAVVTGLRRSGGLKGGVLLASYDLRRPTADVDLAATVRPGDIERMGQCVASIAQVVLSPADSDGLRFDITNLRKETTRDEDEYSGVRVTLAAYLATARETFHVRQCWRPDLAGTGGGDTATSPRRHHQPSGRSDGHGSGREACDRPSERNSQHAMARLRRRLPFSPPVIHWWRWNSEGRSPRWPTSGAETSSR